MQRILSTPAQLGTLVSSGRAAAGLTQAQAAARVGLSQSRYSQIEADPSALPLPVIGNGPDRFNRRQARLAMAVQGSTTSSAAISTRWPGAAASATAPSR